MHFHWHPTGKIYLKKKSVFNRFNCLNNRCTCVNYTLVQYHPCFFIVCIRTYYGNLICLLKIKQKSFYTYYELVFVYNFCSLYCYLLTESALYIGSYISYSICYCRIIRTSTRLRNIVLAPSLLTDLFGWNIIWWNLCKYNNKKLHIMLIRRLS